MLWMNDNRLLEVPDFAFDGISRNLREIHLQRNVILDIGPFAFRALPSLQRLDLSGNQIAEIPSAGLYFDAAPSLVDLSRNRITSIDPDAFSSSVPGRLLAQSLGWVGGDERSVEILMDDTLTFR